MADESTKDKCSILTENFDVKFCAFLDENVQDDLSNVRQCLERMKKEKLELEEQVFKRQQKYCIVKRGQIFISS